MNYLIGEKGHMDRWKRRIRGAIGMGLIWATAWFGAGMILLLMVGLDAADVPFPLGFGMFGFFAGVIFSGVLALATLKRGVEKMSIPRFAGWGALAGTLLAGMFVLVAPFTGNAVEMLVLGPVFALASGMSAAGSLTLARRAGDPRLIGYGAR